MNPAEHQNWKREALDMAFQALAADAELSEKIVYKGARVLALRLGGTHRASYDLDANMLLSFAKEYPNRSDQAEVLSGLLERAIKRHCESQDPVRYELNGLKVIHRPRNDHPMGWNAFDVTVNLRDFQNEGVLGLPNITFDIAAPEDLGENAIAPLKVGEDQVFAYTLERIAGEKMRAFLSTLGAYRRKIKKPGDSVRVKDLYDVAKILRIMPVIHEDFWGNAGIEFRLACASRFIDCDGMETFSENLEVTRATYESEATLPGDVTIDEAWSAVQSIVEIWESLGIVPFSNPLPDS